MMAESEEDIIISSEKENISQTGRFFDNDKLRLIIFLKAIRYYGKPRLEKMGKKKKKR